MYFELGLIFIAVILAVIVTLCLRTRTTESSRGKMTSFVRRKEEMYFLDFSCDPPRKVNFPSLEGNPSLSISIIVPAYNEEKRLPSMLKECLEYLEKRSNTCKDFHYEVIVVDDGSSDGTTKVALGYSKTVGVEKFRVLTLTTNRGKGGAVRLGMLSARGKFVLFADADGATKFGDIEKLEKEMHMLHKKNKYVVVIGSRAHLEKQAIATRSMFRTVLMYGFHMLVWFFGVRTVRDTQCGFKLFSREAAVCLFPALHVERWAFDVELLYIASKVNMIVEEIAVNWTEIEGSKLVPFWSWLQMGKDLMLIWLKYQTGYWKVPKIKKAV